MKISYRVLAVFFAAMVACGTSPARNISVDTPSYFPTPSNPGPGFAFPFLESDSASLTIAEPQSAFIYRLKFVPGPRRAFSAAGTSLGVPLPTPPSSNCASTYYTGAVYPNNPTYICVAYMLNWGLAPNEPPPGDSIESQVMVYQFDTARAIEHGNCTTGACTSALSLLQPDGSTVVIDDPKDVLEVDFNYAAASCKNRTAEFAINDKTYRYVGKDLCAANNVFFFYRSGAEAVLLKHPKGWILDSAT